MRRFLIAAALAAAAVCFVACAGEAPEAEEEDAVPPAKPGAASTWEDVLGKALPALGHRNWIVVADAAFPWQITPGMEVIAAGEDHFAVLDKVLKAIDGSRHIRPKIHLDKELAFVTEALSPGADACRGKLDERLKGRDVDSVLHEELIARLDQAGKTFKVLMIKTTLTIPYTTVFMELDCGYWPTESEARMREAMKKK